MDLKDTEGFQIYQGGTEFTHHLIANPPDYGSTGTSALSGFCCHGGMGEINVDKNGEIIPGCSISIREG